MSQELLVEIGSIIRNQFDIHKEIKKIFAVFVELAQNIIHNSAEKEFSPRARVWSWADLMSRICRKTGGKIWVDSQVGVGSTFNFTIPLSR